MASSIRRAAPIVLPPVGKHTATVIFCHGLGDSGHGWAGAAAQWRQNEKLKGVKWLLPHAPQIPISVNGGMQMPGWFDLKALGYTVEDVQNNRIDEDTPGIVASQEYFHSLIQHEVDSGIPSDRIVLGGFSQGGAMSIFAGVTAPVKIAGIIGLSSWLLLNQMVQEHASKDNVNTATPIFMGQGTNDPLVRYDLANESHKMLKQMGYNITFKAYQGMAHQACDEEFDDVEAFIISRLTAQE
ncbi:Acyl-protein thioesterase 1 [Paramyrothecium foliicola]|nr:Acyl-protein thioesterase 1 [Paramyrothecium foliicola]